MFRHTFLFADSQIPEDLTAATIFRLIRHPRHDVEMNMRMFNLRELLYQQFIDDGGFSDSGIAGNQHQLRPATGDHTIKRCK